MAYTASQNTKTSTTYMAATLFAALIFIAGIAALTVQPAEAFAKPLCGGNGPCYASASANANTADSASPLRKSMACMRSVIEGKLCAQGCFSRNGAAFIDENGNGICDNYENGLCPGGGFGYGYGNGLDNGAGAQSGNAIGGGNGYGACINGGSCGYAYNYGACNGSGHGCQRAQNCPNR